MIARAQALEASVLAPLLPTPEQTMFFRACVGTPEIAAAAWEHWCRDSTANGAPLLHTLEPFKRFLPLLSWNLARANVRIGDERLAARLQATRQAEAHQWLRFWIDAHAAFAALHDAAIPFIALKGVALSERVYPSPTFRPKADIDVWLRPTDLDRAFALLRRQGWKQYPAPLLPHPQHLPALARGKGHPLELHRWALMPYYTLRWEDLDARATPATLCGVETRALSRTDALLHTIGHAMSAYGLPTLPWVADARFLLDADQPFDWPTFVTTAREANLSLACSTALRYLAEQIGIDLQATALTELETDAARTGIRARAAARLAARPWPLGSLSEIVRSRRSWPRRASLLWRRLFPPPVELSLRYDVPLWTVPFYYALRIVRYARPPRS